jgi:hypothetical protein
MAGLMSGLVFRPARQPPWLLGMASMILGSSSRSAPGVSGRWPWFSRSWL